MKLITSQINMNIFLAPNMKTITSDKNLICWKRNENGSNITLSSLNGDDMILKEHYRNVFAKVAETLHEGPKSSFLTIWFKACNEEYSKLTKHISDVLRSNNCFVSDDNIARVAVKFRGNLGEILIEMFAENGILDFIKPGSYIPVDPDNEQYIDAEAIRNGLPIGIQIKNYNEFSRIERTVLTKASAMSDLWLRRDKRIADEDVLDFIKTPCQYIISTVDPSSEMLCDNYKSSVVFLGPKWFESKKIHGSIKSGEMPMWRMFNEVAKMLD